MTKIWVWAAAWLLVACSATGQEPGPPQVRTTPGSLGIHRHVGTLCLPLKSHRHFVVGWETLYNRASTPVTITSVDAARAHGLTVAGARLVDLPGGRGNLVGLWAGLHPRFNAHAERLMKSSRRAVGSQIEGRQTVNLVLLLTSAEGGRSGPATVTYTDADGLPHSWKGGSSMIIEPGQAC
jgi:hypothetical protein